MKNYTKISVGQDARTELHHQLGLTGAEISVNNLPAGAGVPFVHYHHKNEEIYMILSGRGQAVLDSETVALNAGDWLRIAPETRRQFSAAADSAISYISAAADSAISYICIQVRANSLEEYTAADATIEQ